MEATVTSVKEAKAMRAMVMRLRARRRAALRRPREAMERCGAAWRLRRRRMAMAASVEMSSNDPAERKAVAWGILLMRPRMRRPSAGRKVARARMGARVRFDLLTVGRSHAPARSEALWAALRRRTDQKMARKAIMRLETKPVMAVRGRVWRCRAVVPTAPIHHVRRA